MRGRETIYCIIILSFYLRIIHKMRIILCLGRSWRRDRDWGKSQWRFCWCVWLVVGSERGQPSLTTTTTTKTRIHRTYIRENLHFLVLLFPSPQVGIWKWKNPVYTVKPYKDWVFLWVIFIITMITFIVVGVAEQSTVAFFYTAQVKWEYEVEGKNKQPLPYKSERG